ncbi:hypothetical protein BPUTEOMOX_10 [methanotrophic endosymbiont of Bathymodiolus puteoserpentis (Logatchev)]|nr:hypothetical protein BPUTEOMOX_10 [methanotrophic endosymbiont of Bathymodiolus puteoserpentis (Logatchev)]
MVGAPLVFQCILIGLSYMCGIAEIVIPYKFWLQTVLGCGR